jgi:hypothetical protein
MSVLFTKLIYFHQNIVLNVERIYKLNFVFVDDKSTRLVAKNGQTIHMVLIYAAVMIM